MTVKDVVIFASGAAVGSLTVYILMNRKLKTKNQDISDMRDLMRRREKESQKGPEKPVEASENDSKEEAKENTESHFKGDVEAQNELKEELLRDRYNYSRISTGDSPEDDSGEVSPSVHKRSMIYRITQDEFNANETYDKVTATYYIPQHILTDENDERMSMESIGGEDMLSDFDEESSIYIRNDALEIDYEVVLDDINTWTDPNEG